MKKGVFSLAGVLSLIIGANLVMAGAVITGTVSCKGVKNPNDTIVYIEKIDGSFAPSEAHALVDQQSLVYVPHVVAVLVGTIVDFPNSDTVRHNVFSPPGSAKVFDLGTYDAGVTKSIAFDVVGETTLLCNVHPEMSAFVVAMQNPYFVVTDKTGVYTLNDVPSGKYTLTTWHERLKSDSREVEVKNGDTLTVNLELKKKK